MGCIHKSSTQSGYIILEIATAISVIGLTAGGILLAKELMKDAQSFSMISQAQQFDTAVNTFRLKYNCLPGDCAKATQFMSTIYNGNGDGVVNPYTAMQPPYYEHYQFWRMLALSEVIEGAYTGTALEQGANANQQFRGGVNVPNTRFNGGHAAYLHVNHKSYYQFGQNSAVLHDDRSYPLFSGLQASMMDIKYDDGNPATGRITAARSVEQSTGCYDVAHRYVLTEDTACIIHISSGF